MFLLSIWGKRNKHNYMNNIKRNPKHRSATANEKIVYEYFRRINNKDLNGMLNLFADDAIIYEPFSNVGGLRGKSAIKPFFDVVLMANDGLQHMIEFVKSQNASNDNNQVIALVTFERGRTVQGQYTFVLRSEQEEQYRYRREKRIQTLHIEFIK
jgi:ketosteroid isomerase-like protein